MGPTPTGSETKRETLGRIRGAQWHSGGCRLGPSTAITANRVPSDVEGVAPVGCVPGVSLRRYVSG
jgi:hypothetical protein